MKLLILTQKVDINDDLLGFMPGWIVEFAKQCEKVTVVCLAKGVFKFPANVKVLSLGKETGKSKIKYLVNFYKQIWRERQNYDTVLVHMNKEYVVLGGLLWRLLGKKIALWHVHKVVDFKLRLAEKLSNIIFTSSKEGFNLKSQKLKIIGHGVDLNKFYYRPRAKSEGNFKIIYVGRISRIKHQEILIEAINVLVNERGVKNAKADLVGSPVYQDDSDYKNELVKQIKDNQLENYIQFIGSVPNKDMAEIYRLADLSVNLCPTGGMDKAVLESMVSGVPVIAHNKTFISLLSENNLLLENLAAVELADKIIGLIDLRLEQRLAIGQNLRKKIVQNYDLAGLVGKIVSSLENKYGK